VNRSTPRDGRTACVRACVWQDHRRRRLFRRRRSSPTTTHTRILIIPRRRRRRPPQRGRPARSGTVRQSVREHISKTGRSNVAIRDCSTDAECDGRLGETCVRLYDGCGRGQCMCDPAASGRPAAGPPSPGSTDDDADPARPWDVVAADDRRSRQPPPPPPPPPGYCHHRHHHHRRRGRMFDTQIRCEM